MWLAGKSGWCLQRLILVTLFLCISIAVLTAIPPTGSSHEPITTKVTFNKEIVRIFERSCLGCHREGRLLTDIPLATYEQARPWAKAIKEEILEKRMPPFQSVKGFGNFKHDYILPQRDIDLIISWVEGGAPKGNDKDLPRPGAGASGWALGQPDLILQPESETIIPAPGEELVRCFTLPTGLSEGRLLSAVDFQPGDGRVVHCAALVLDHPSPPGLVNVAAQRAAECLINSGEPVSDRLLNWVPGQAATRWPAGVAQLLPSGARVVLKIHYRPTDAEASDRSRVGLYFAREQSPKQVRGVAINARPTQISPGAERHCVKGSYLVPEAIEAVAIRPLLFPLGKSVEAKAYRPDRTVEVLIWAKNYRVDWQPTYHFKQLVGLPKGTRIEVTAYLDNPDEKSIQFASPLCELFFTASK
jgi:hypothetical protein